MIILINFIAAWVRVMVTLSLVAIIGIVILSGLLVIDRYIRNRFLHIVVAFTWVTFAVATVVSLLSSFG